MRRLPGAMARTGLEPATCSTSDLAAPRGWASGGLLYPLSYLAVADPGVEPGIPTLKGWCLNRMAHRPSSRAAPGDVRTADDRPASATPVH